MESQDMVLEVTSLECISADEFEEALQILRKSETLLEALATHGGEVDADQVLVTLHNTACCYQRCGIDRISRLEEAAAYMNGCTYNLKTRPSPPSPSPSPEQHISLSRQRCKSHMQLCGLLSQLHKHEAAQHHAFKAFKFAEICVQETLFVCKQNLKQVKLKEKGLISQSQNPAQMTDLAQRAIPILEQLVSRVHPRAGDPPATKVRRMDVRTVLGVQNLLDWIYAYEISDVMRIDPISGEDLKQTYGVEIELTQTMLLEKICLLAAACFCLSAETRFIGSVSGTNKKLQTQGKSWHQKAVGIAEDFLPLECPLSNHIKQTYLQSYGENALSARTKTSKKERSLSRGKTSQNVSQHLKSPASTRTTKIVRQIFARTRSTSAKSRKKASPSGNKRTEVSPKPFRTPTRPVTAQSDKRLPKCVLAVSASFKTPKTARKEEGKGLSKTKIGRSVPVIKEEGTGLGISSLRKPGVENKGKTRQISPEPDSHMTENSELKQEWTTPDLEEVDSPMNRLVFTSNQLYGIASPESSHEEQDSEHLSPAFLTGEGKKVEGEGTDADKFRQVSSTGGRN